MTFLPTRNCARELCGSLTPAVFQAFWVSPEQSQLLGPVRAVAVTVAELPLREGKAF